MGISSPYEACWLLKATPQLNTLYLHEFIFVTCSLHFTFRPMLHISFRCSWLFFAMNLEWPAGASPKREEWSEISTSDKGPAIRVRMFMWTLTYIRVRFTCVSISFTCEAITNHSIAPGKPWGIAWGIGLDLEIFILNDCSRLDFQLKICELSHSLA